MPSHAIWGDRIASRGTTPWGRIGINLTGSQDTATEALVRAGADYDVVTQPLYRLSLTTGQPIETDRVAIVRPGYQGVDEVMLGHASTRYRPLQNRELAAILDPFVEMYPVEAVGAMGRGESTFVTLDMGARDVGGDEIHLYLFAVNSFTGAEALQLMVTTVRATCANMLALGLRNATISADVRHTRRIIQETSLAVQLLARLQRARDESLDGLNALTRVKLSYGDIQHALRVIYPTPPVPPVVEQVRAAREAGVGLADDMLAKLANADEKIERDEARTQALRSATWEAYEQLCDEKPAYAFTAWLLYNAVTQNATWRQGGSEPAIVKNVVVSGERHDEMVRAYQHLVALA